MKTKNDSTTMRVASRVCWFQKSNSTTSRKLLKVDPEEISTNENFALTIVSSKSIKYGRKLDLMV